MAPDATTRGDQANLMLVAGCRGEGSASSSEHQEVESKKGGHTWRKSTSMHSG